MTGFAEPSSYDDYVQQVQSRLERLPKSCRIAFACWVGERLFEAYLSFYDVHQWGDPNTYRESLDRVWNHIGGSTLSALEIDELAERCLRFAPDMDEFGDSGAVLACSVIASAVEACRSESDWLESLDCAENAYSYAIDETSLRSVASDSECDLWTSFGSQDEVRTQLAFIQFLEQLPAIESDAIRKWRNRGGGPLPERI